MIVSEEKNRTSRLQEDYSSNTIYRNTFWVPRPACSLITVIFLLAPKWDIFKPPTNSPTPSPSSTTNVRPRRKPFDSITPRLILSLVHLDVFGHGIVTLYTVHSTAIKAHRLGAFWSHLNVWFFLTNLGQSLHRLPKQESISSVICFISADFLINSPLRYVPSYVRIKPTFHLHGERWLSDSLPRIIPYVLSVGFLLYPEGVLPTV